VQTSLSVFIVELHKYILSIKVEKYQFYKNL